MVEKTPERRIAALETATAKLATLLIERTGAVAILADVVARAIPMAQPQLQRHLAHEIALLKKQEPALPGLIAACEEMLGAIDRAGK